MTTESNGNRQEFERAQRNLVTSTMNGPNSDSCSIFSLPLSPCVFCFVYVFLCVSFSTIFAPLEFSYCHCFSLESSLFCLVFFDSFWRSLPVVICFFSFPYSSLSRSLSRSFVNLPCVSLYCFLLFVDLLNTKINSNFFQGKFF